MRGSSDSMIIVLGAENNAHGDRWERWRTHRYSQKQRISQTRSVDEEHGRESRSGHGNAEPKMVPLVIILKMSAQPQLGIYLPCEALWVVEPCEIPTRREAQ